MDANKTKYSVIPTENNFGKSGQQNLVKPQNSVVNSGVSGPRFGKRHIQTICLSIILIVMYLMRISISVALVAMTNKKGHMNENIPVYDWPDKSLILSAFMWGYFATQPFAGWVVTRFGGKWFLVGSLICSSFLNALVPICASLFGSYGVMVCRTLLGISQSFLYPSLNCLLGKWAPANERSRLGCIIFAGSSLGIVLSMTISGYLCSTWYGWPIVFYIFSIVAVFCALLYSYIGSDSPAKHSTISQEERYYIESNLPKITHTEKLATPWKSIFTSLPFWALFISECGNNWGHWTLLSQIPNYLVNVMKFNMKSYGALSALPYLLQWIMAYVYGFFADFLISRKMVSITTTRKIMNGIAFVGPGLALIIIGNSTSDNYVMVLVLLMLGVSCISAGKSGHLVNYVDLSPNHSGTLIGFCNGFSIGYASLGNVMVHLVVTNDEDPNQWNIIFFWSAGTYAVATLIYSIFGSGEVQSWNDKKRRHPNLI